jgi:hypothetical protein
MRRLYILPKSVWSGSARIGTTQAEDGTQSPVMIEMVRLFHPVIGSHYIDLSTNALSNDDLPNNLVLMCTSFDHDERAEDLLHAHAEVAILPHPTLAGTVKLKDHVDAPGYKFAQKHLEALKGHATLGFSEMDTVLDLARKASAIHPEIKFRNVL